MLLALIGAFSLSQAFRTAAAIMAPPLQREFGLSAQALGLFAAAFHFAFGGLQLFMGIGIDMVGIRRTILWAFPLAIAGSCITALAHGFPMLVLGQALTGIGCAPAFLVCTVLIARAFPPQRFAAVSGMTLGLGSVGLLLTGTPLAWVIETFSWRTGYWIFAALSALAWLGILLIVREPPTHEVERPASVWAALRGYGVLFRLPHTAGILAMSLVTYASFLSLRGLWLGPLLIERHGFSLVNSGNVALVLSVIGMVAPPLFGRLDPGDAKRRRWISGFALVAVTGYAAMAFNAGGTGDVVLALAIGLVSGFAVLQYADVRVAYPPEMIGRAMAVFTMAMFLGVALMQSLTGWVATTAARLGMDPYAAVLGTIAGLLAAGAAAYRLLPAPAAARAR